MNYTYSVDNAALWPPESDRVGWTNGGQTELNGLTFAKSTGLRNPNTHPPFFQPTRAVAGAQQITRILPSIGKMFTRNHHRHHNTDTANLLEAEVVAQSSEPDNDNNNNNDAVQVNQSGSNAFSRTNGNIRPKSESTN